MLEAGPGSLTRYVTIMMIALSLEGLVLVLEAELERMRQAD